MHYINIATQTIIPIIIRGAAWDTKHGKQDERGVSHNFSGDIQDIPQEA